MKYEEFSNELMERLQQQEVGKSLKFKSVTVQTVNGAKEGITVEGQDISLAPVLYYEDAYKQYCEGTTMEQIVGTFTECFCDFEKFAPPMPDLSKSAVIKKLYCSVIGVESNEELLKNIPHEVVGDLAVVARYRVAHNASILMNNQICKHLEMTPAEIMQLAHKNTNKERYICIGLESCISDLICGQKTSDNFGMYVLSNESMVDGASAIVSRNALNQAYEVIGENFYILPSSRHELILIGQSKVDDVGFLRNMVKEVNETVVDKRDKLSDNVYYYDDALKQFRCA